MISSRFRQGVRRAVFAVIILGLSTTAVTHARAQVAARDVLEIYADIAHATYEDSLVTAQTLRTVIKVFLATPTAQTMRAARAAWIAAREPY